MISEEQFFRWLGFSWNDFKKWLEENQIAYEVEIWPPDERSQFVVDTDQCYVMKILVLSDHIQVKIAGKMLGRKDG